MTRDALHADAYFAVIPEWVLDADISAQAVRLYGILRRYADEQGRCHPGRKALAERMHTSPSTVDRATEELRAIGALTSTPRFDDRGDQTSNEYRLYAAPPSSRMSRGLLTGDDTPSSPVTNEREPVELELPPTPADAGADVCKHGPRCRLRSCARNPRAVAAAEVKSRRQAVRSRCPPSCDNGWLLGGDGTQLDPPVPCPTCKPHHVQEVRSA